MQGSNSSIPLFIKLPGITSFEGLDFAGAYVYHLKDTIILKFMHRFAGIKPDQLQLFKLEGSSRTLLDPTQTLAEAGIHSGTKLGVEITAPVAPTVTGVWCH